MKKQIEYIKVSELQLNPNNPRHNDEAVDTVALSIQKYGFNNPCIVWNGVVYCGNTRLKAAQKLGLKEIPCIVVNDLTEQQIREYALIDNKSSEIAEWDYDMLQEELDVLDLGEFDLDWDVADFVEQNEKDNPYTMKVDVPQYEMKGEKPDIEELYDDQKTKELLEEIKNSSLDKKEKEFLIKASQRHLVFDYSKIAEYYAHASKEMQELMEKSALVIIDFDDAIANGFVEVRKEIEEMRLEGEDEE